MLCLHSSGQPPVSGISRDTRYVTHAILSVPDNDISFMALHSMRAVMLRSEEQGNI
jgi:hypothetical protein